MGRSLFQISDDLLELEAKLAEAGGEIGEDESGKALEAFFDQLGEERNSKLDGYCALIHEMEARADAREAEAKRLHALAATDYNDAERLRKGLKLFFEIQKINKLDTARFRISIAENGGKAPLVVPEEWEKNPAAAPEEFHKRKIELDKDAIRTALETYTQASLKSGMEPVEFITSEEGQKLREPIKDCYIGQRGTHLRIK